MELMYNELSVDPLSPDKYAANAKMKLFSETVAEARQKGFGISVHITIHIRYNLQLVIPYMIGLIIKMFQKY